MNILKTSGAAIAIAACFYASSSLAGGSHAHTQHLHANQVENETPLDIGHIGAQENVQRTQKIVMYDNRACLSISSKTSGSSASGI